MQNHISAFLVLFLLVGGCAPKQIHFPVAEVGAITARNQEILQEITTVLATSNIPPDQKASLIDAFRRSFDEFVKTTAELVRHYLTITAARQQERASNIVSILLQILGLATSGVLIGKNVSLTPEEYQRIGREVYEMQSISFLAED